MLFSYIQASANKNKGIDNITKKEDSKKLLNRLEK